MGNVRSTFWRWTQEPEWRPASCERGRENAFHPARSSRASKLVCEGAAVYKHDMMYYNAGVGVVSDAMLARGSSRKECHSHVLWTSLTITCTRHVQAVP
jgi:hypothetical protein